jgi:oligopeptide transport system substrate-binding protein
MQLFLAFLCNRVSCVILLSLFFSSGFDASASEFRVRLSSRPQTLDWSSATSGSEGAVIQNLMDGLFGFDSQSNLVPVLVKSYRWSSDAKTLEIDLKKNVHWSDGTRLKSAHILDSFEHLLNPSVNSANASLLFDVVGARNYFYGKIKNFSQVGITAPRDDQVRITLTEPRANFLNTLTHWATFPYRKDKPSQTLGPYQLSKKQGDQIDLIANSKYYGKSTEIKKVSFQTIADGALALKNFQAKKIDYLLQLEDAFLEKNKSLQGLDFVDPIRVVALLHLNPSRVSTDSPEKRRKVMAAINLRELIGAHSANRVAAPSMIPRGLAGGPAPSNQKSFVPAASDVALPDSGLTLAYPNDALSKSIAERIQQTSKAVKIKIEALPQNAQASFYKRYDLIISLFGLDFSDPDQLFGAFLSQGTLDFFSLNSGELLSLVQKARSTPNIKERALLYASAADYLQNQIAVVMPLFYRRRAFLLNPHFKGESGASGSPRISRIHRVK